MRPTDHLTVGALRLLSRARVILSIGVEHSTLFAQSEARLVSLDDVYYEGASDNDNYARIIERVRPHLETPGLILLLVPGHPRVGVTITHTLEKLCAEQQIGFHCEPGISSFDTMLNDVALDPLDRGTFVADANRLLLFEQPPNPIFGTFIYHVCSVGTAKTHIQDPSVSNRIDLLVRLLLRAYPPHHRIWLLRSETADLPAARDAVALDELTSAMSMITFATTLYVPPIHPKNVDRSFLSLLSESGTDGG